VNLGGVLVDEVPLRPKDHINVLEERSSKPLLSAPNKQQWNPVDLPHGVPQDFTEVLAGLIGEEARPFLSAAEIAAGAAGDRMMIGDDLDVWEHRLEERVSANTSIKDTNREAIIRARRGQSLFKQRVMQIEARCRRTVENPFHLVASHCKPWRDSNNEERLNGENGLLLTPRIDHLFDRGFSGFEDNGTLIIAPVAHGPSLQRWASRHAAW